MPWLSCIPSDSVQSVWHTAPIRIVTYFGVLNKRRAGLDASVGDVRPAQHNASDSDLSLDDKEVALGIKLEASRLPQIIRKYLVLHARRRLGIRILGRQTIALRKRQAGMKDDKTSPDKKHPARVPG